MKKILSLVLALALVLTIGILAVSADDTANLNVSWMIVDLNTTTSVGDTEATSTIFKDHTLDVTVITSGEVYDKAAAALEYIAGSFTVQNVVLKKNGTPTNASKNVYLYFKLISGLDKQTSVNQKIYKINDNGTVTDMAAFWFQNPSNLLQFMTFETGAFNGNYAIVDVRGAKVDPNANNNNNNENPVPTGDTFSPAVIIAIMSVSAVVFAGIVVFAVKRKKANDAK
jgi:hypothetical protein